MDAYALDGVDIEEGDDFSAFAGAVCHRSFNNSQYIRVHDLSDGYFRGVRSFNPINLPEGWSLDLTSDGVGTKVIVHDAALMHKGAAQDLVAMCCGDITRNGGCPVLFNNDLSAQSIGKKGDEVNQAFRGMIDELGRIAEQMNIVLFRGETAELPGCIKFNNPTARASFVWSGSALGLYMPQLMITGGSVTAGDQIIALKELGFRANGISSVRKAFTERYGTGWFDHPVALLEGGHLSQAAVPSVLYDPFLTHINGWYTGSFEPLVSVKQLIHVTGGAFGGKLGADFLFRRRLSADLPDLFDPPEIMQLCQEWRGMTDEEAYSTWNGGQGLLAIVSPDDVTGFLSAATEFGHVAKVCGQVTKSPEPKITITSKFSGEVITYS